MTSRAYGNEALKNHTCLGQGASEIFSIAIYFPESLMSSRTFRDTFLDYYSKVSIKDIASIGVSTVIHYIQDSDTINYLKNNFFNLKYNSFIIVKDKWALSADTE